MLLAKLTKLVIVYTTNLILFYSVLACCKQGAKSFLSPFSLICHLSPSILPL
jgi:hypothetical protein